MSKKRPQKQHPGKKNNKGSYNKSQKDKKSRYIFGTVSMNSKGVGYVAIKEDDPREKHIVIDPTFLRTALNGDKVKVLLHPRTPRRQRSGEVVEILQRKKTVFSGTCILRDGICEIKPKDRKMYTSIVIPDKSRNGAEYNDKVMVEITSWKNEHEPPVGKVLKVLGKTGEHEAEMQAIVEEWGFVLDFPDEVIDEIKDITNKKEYLGEAERSHREDFRNVTTFTIDPFDAKDFDDALSVRKIDGDFYEIGIHIADVSFFVRPGTHLDDEACKRATSVYLVDRTIPMLPLELSTDLCSLNEGVDRLTMSAIIEIDTSGHIRKSRFAECVINSDKRFTYEEAQEVLDTSSGPFLEELSILRSIGEVLRKKRRKDGALMLEGEEVKFVLDEKKFPVDIKIKIHQDTNHLIEEFMLLANEEVTKWAEDKIQKGIIDTFVYRVHPYPDSIKIEKLKNFLAGMGYTVKLDKDGLIPSSFLNRTVEEAPSHPIKDALTSMITRSMAKAYYTVSNLGHYGLAKDFYTHFTSPIRRYPDLVVHRIVRSILRQTNKNDRRSEYLDICEQSSAREKDAQQAERESIRYKQVEYMSVRIGQEFDGAVTGVTEWGIYVEEEKSLAEGLIRLPDISKDEGFVFDEKHLTLTGEKTKKVYRIGDKVKILVAGVDLEKAYIDYNVI